MRYVACRMELEVQEPCRQATTEPAFPNQAFLGSRWEIAPGARRRPEMHLQVGRCWRAARWGHGAFQGTGGKDIDPDRLGIRSDLDQPRLCPEILGPDRQPPPRTRRQAQDELPRYCRGTLHDVLPRLLLGRARHSVKGDRGFQCFTLPFGQPQLEARVLGLSAASNRQQPTAAQQGRSNGPELPVPAPPGNQHEPDTWQEILPLG